MWGEIIAGICVALVIVSAVVYIFICKKRGRKCIGCPDSGACKSQSKDKKCGGCSGNCSCCNQVESETEDLQEE